MNSTLVDFESLWKILDVFLFHQESVIWLAVYRIFFASIGIFYWFLVRKDFDCLYGDRGLISSSWRKSHGWQSLLPFSFRVGHRNFNVIPLRVVDKVHFVSLICLLVGFHSQLAAFLVFSSYAYLNIRNPHCEAGPEQLLRVMSFLFIFAPADRGLSVAKFFETGDWLSMDQVSAWSLQFMRVQILIVVLQTFFSKIEATSWRDGSAVYWVMQNVQFAKKSFLPKDFQSPRVYTLMTYGTLVIQAVTPFLIWLRGANLASIVGLAVLHVGLFFSVRVGLYQPLMIGSLVLFL